MLRSSRHRRVLVVVAVAAVALAAACLPAGCAAGTRPLPEPQEDEEDAPCTPGDAAQATLGPDGGAVALCGASLTVPPGVLAADGAFSLTVVAPPGPLPFGLEPAGLAFAVAGDGAAEVTLTLPVARDDRIVRMMRFDDGEGFIELEPCLVEDARVGQDVAPGFVYAALREDRAYPPSKEGLGEGTMARALDGGAADAFDVDSALGFAFFDESEDGARFYTLFATIPAGDDGAIDTLRLVFAVDAAGAGSMLEVSTGSTADPQGFYQWLAPVDVTGATIALAGGDLAGDAPRVIGAVDAAVRRGDATAALTVDVDVTAERFRFPPEASCGFPEG